MRLGVLPHAALARKMLSAKLTLVLAFGQVLCLMCDHLLVGIEALQYTKMNPSLEKVPLVCPRESSCFFSSLIRPSQFEGCRRIKWRNFSTCTMLTRQNKEGFFEGQEEKLEQRERKKERVSELGNNNFASFFSATKKVSKALQQQKAEVSSF
jgi:hypothetical protein